MKIIGIGLHRTGTTSLRKALKILGCGKIIGPISPPLQGGDEGYWQNVLLRLRKANGATDAPWFHWFEEIDAIFDCKFIYTLRPMDVWLQSMFAWFGDNGEKGKAVYKWLYKDKTILQYYQWHDMKVREYFYGKGDNLLVMEISEGWEPICNFLDKPIPQLPFPHLKAS